MCCSAFLMAYFIGQHWQNCITNTSQSGFLFSLNTHMQHGIANILSQNTICWLFAEQKVWQCCLIRGCCKMAMCLVWPVAVGLCMNHMLTFHWSFETGRTQPWHHRHQWLTSSSCSSGNPLLQHPPRRWLQSQWHRPAAHIQTCFSAIEHYNHFVINHFVMKHNKYSKRQGQQLRLKQRSQKFLSPCTRSMWFSGGGDDHSFLAIVLSCQAITHMNPSIQN